MNVSLNKKKSKDRKNQVSMAPVGHLGGFVAQFFVFHGERYLGWDCFDTRTVRVGRSSSADLVLEDPALAEIQAEFLIKDNGILVADLAKNGSLTVNNQAATRCLVGPLDVVKIGAYTIKIKLKGMETLPAQGTVMKAVSEVDACAPLDPSGLCDDMDDDDLEPVDVEALLGVASDRDAASGPKEEDDAADIVERFAGVGDAVDASLDVTLRVRRPVEDAVDIIGDDALTLDRPAPKTQAPSAAPTIMTPVRAEKQSKAKQAAEPLGAKPELTHTFPPSFFTVIEDEEDHEDEDFPAAFSLRDTLIGPSRNAGRTAVGQKVLEIITLRKDNVLDITHLKDRGVHVLIDDKKQFCRVSHDEKQGTRLVFSEPLLGTINRVSDKEFKAEKTFSAGRFLSGCKTYSSLLPSKGELILSDGFYDYVLRQSFISPTPIIDEGPRDDAPMPKRVLRSTAFKYASRAVGFHIILMIILSYSITLPDKAEFKNPETYFVMVETENIHKPVKPKPKPRPVIPEKVVKTKKAPPKAQAQVAALNPKKTTPKPDKAEAPKAGGGHKGTVVNRNVNDMGLLATLGMKTGIEIKPNEALASVTNMDAITSSHAKEARIKVGGLVGDLGDGRIAIPSGGVINNKGAADVLRSAGIGGKGTVAALASGNTGQREVSGAVSAPLTKKAKFKGGGISREAVAKVINDHIDEINYCYETALIHDPTLMGKIEFEWVILLSGKVGEVRIKSSTVKSNEIHSCIKSAIRTWVFPKPQGSAVEVSYPFVFDVSGF